MKRTLLSAIGIAVGLALAGSASAYNVYNKTTDPTGGSIEVWGEHCMQCFHGKVKQGEHKSCPGNDKGCGGHTEITACVLARSAQFGANEMSLRRCSVKVPAHGWVEFVDVFPPGIWSDGAYVGCIVYDDAGKVLNPDDKSMSSPGGYNTCQ